MTSVQLSRRKDTNSAIMAYVGVIAEFLYNTTTGRIHAMDGDTPGGIPMARLDELPQPSAGFANRILNGDFALDQENEGAAYSVSGTTKQVADGWKALAFGGGALSVQRVVNSVKTGLTEDFAYCLQATVTTADASLAAADIYALQTTILPDEMDDFGFSNSLAKTTSYSFWAKSGVTGTFFGRLAEYSGTRSYVFDFTISSANTWTKITVTVPGDTTGTWATGCVLSIALGSGSDRFTPSLDTWQAGNYYSFTGGANFMGTLSNVLSLTGVQLEIGSVANNFARVPLASALNRAMRRYQKSYAAGTAIGTATRLGSAFWRPPVIATSDWASIQLPVKMAATPSVTLYSTNTGTAGQVYNQGAAADVAATVVDAANSGFGINHAAAAVDQGYRAQWTADVRP